MKPTDRYAMRDARIRESRQNEARILLHDEIQGYKDRIAELEKELAELKAATQTAKEPEDATAPEAEKSPATASGQEPTPSPADQPEAATQAAKGKSKGKK